MMDVSPRHQPQAINTQRPKGSLPSKKSIYTRAAKSSSNYHYLDKVLTTPIPGILKNTASYNDATSPTTPSNGIYDSGVLPDEPSSSALSTSNDPRRPSMNRDLSEKELTHANTLANAGPRRSSSSNPRRGSTPGSRRQSGILLANGSRPGSSGGSGSNETGPDSMDIDGDGMNDEARHLKWDEANLYLTEQERGHTMKIDEPKTPYVRQYDPSQDEEEIAAIDASGMMVDELDLAHGAQTPDTTSESSSGTNGRQALRRGNSIPDLDLGEPEEPVHERHGSEGEKRVFVSDQELQGHVPEEVPWESMNAEERRKHQEFQDMRKRHYDMHNVRDVLG